MNKIEVFCDFLAEHWESAILIYVIVAAIVFAAVIAFFLWVCKAEEKERELYPDDAYYYPDELGAAGTAKTICIAIPIALGCALLWFGIPVILLGVWAYSTITEKFPELMGHMADDDEEETEEKHDF